MFGYIYCSEAQGEAAYHDRRAWQREAFQEMEGRKQRELEGRAAGKMHLLVGHTRTDLSLLVLPHFPTVTSQSVHSNSQSNNFISKYFCIGTGAFGGDPSHLSHNK